MFSRDLEKLFTTHSVGLRIHLFSRRLATSQSSIILAKAYYLKQFCMPAKCEVVLNCNLFGKVHVFGS